MTQRRSKEVIYICRIFFRSSLPLTVEIYIMTLLICLTFTFRVTLTFFFVRVSANSLFFLCVCFYRNMAMLVILRERTAAAQ